MQCAAVTGQQQQLSKNIILKNLASKPTTPTVKKNFIVIVLTSAFHACTGWKTDAKTMTMTRTCDG
jgi:hypothetical protein